MSAAAETGVSLTINGAHQQLANSPTQRLSSVLRDTLELTGTKIGCDAGDCGACTVLIDDHAACSCLVPIGALDGAEIESVESLASSDLGASLAASFLRHGAAQCGFCTPGMLMAALGVLRENPNPSRDDVVSGLAGVLCRCTGYQKIIDAVLDFDHAGDPLELSAGKAVGGRLERVDGQAKIDGTEAFGADAVPRDALTIKVVRSPHHRGSFALGNIDEYVARNPLVRLVITANEIAGQNAFGVIPGFEDQPVLAESAARFLGEAVALVVGDKLDESILDDFPVAWTELPPALSPGVALAAGADALHSHAPDNVMIRGLVQTGHVDTALASAGAVVSGRFTTSFVEHAYIEPEAGWAELIDGVVTIHATTQAPYMDREATAKVLGVPVDSVRIIPTGCGGGFGGKLDISVQPLLALATTLTGMPTAIVYTRPESILSTTKRHPAEIEATIAASTDGDIVAMTFEGTFNTGAYASWGPTVANRVP
ncbi:MAG: molybdopterin cofactor-binding domain-containing protein, partial [Acidimicrobiales bacterium]